jgi:translation initiation factor 2 subunit 1
MVSWFHKIFNSFLFLAFNTPISNILPPFFNLFFLPLPGINGLPEDVKAMLLANIKRRLTPQPIKIRADVDVSCYSYQGIDAVKNALREAKKFGTKDFPMTISLIAPPQYTIQTSSLEKKEGIDRCNKAVEAVRASILAAGGRLAVKMEAKATTSRDEEELARHLAIMASENNEVDGDDD